MRRPICALMALACAIAPAAAGERYDRKLEQAAMRIVAENIGDIRGGFSYEQKPGFVVIQDVPVPSTDSSTGGGENISPSIVGPAALPKS